MIGPTCPRCNTVHPSNAAVAVGRYTGQEVGYVANLTDRPTVLRETRAEAEADYCAAKSAPVYGMCTACGSIEVALVKATGWRDFSSIGEHPAYPTGYGCEACA